MYKLTFLLIFGLLFLSSCSQIKEKDFIGSWIINTANFNGSPVKMANEPFKVFYLPDKYQNKFILKFKADFTVNFPGIYPQTIPCKWIIKNNQLVVSFDTLRFHNNALIQIDSLATLSALLKKDTVLRKKYIHKSDSILDIENINRFSKPINIYTGVYDIKKTKDQLIITSPTTKIELINKNEALKKYLDSVLSLKAKL